MCRSTHAADSFRKTTSTRFIVLNVGPHHHQDRDKSNVKPSLRIRVVTTSLVFPFISRPHSYPSPFPLLNKYLDFVGVDKSCQVRVGHAGAGQFVSLLHQAGALRSAKNGVQLLEGALGPHDEPTQMAPGCQLQQVESVYRAHLARASRGWSCLIGSFTDPASLSCMS